MTNSLFIGLFILVLLAFYAIARWNPEFFRWYAGKSLRRLNILVVGGWIVVIVSGTLGLFADSNFGILVSGMVLVSIALVVMALIISVITQITTSKNKDKHKGS